MRECCKEANHRWMRLNRYRQSNAPRPLEVAVDLKDLRARLAAERIDAEKRRPCRPTAGVILASWMVKQKAHRKAAYSGSSGRFPCQLELLAYLGTELSAGRRSQTEIAHDAHITPSALNYIIKADKFRWMRMVEMAAVPMPGDIQLMQQI